MLRRLQNSGQIIGGCAACCAAAILIICMATLGHGVTSGFPRAMHTSKNAHAQLLQARTQPTNGIGSAKSRSVIERYKQFPLSFEPNLQQTDNADVKFLARGNGYILFLTGKDAVFSMGKAAHSSAVMRMSLLGANSNPSFSGMDELPGKSNYIIGNQPDKWHTNIPNYRKVSERNIYPGIDLVYYGTQRQLEYDFVVAPGTSPSKIKIAFSGAKNLHTDANGDLVLSAAGVDDVRLHKPVVYQQFGNDKKLVAANYILSGKDSVEFAIGNYDTARPLIVDPILAYSTYLGGSGIDGANAIAIAPDNTAFVAGSTFSTDFPVIHALQPNEGGGVDFPQDAFVSKISADGSTLLYSTYLGGENTDTGNGIAVDSFGNAYVVGTTLSPHFPIIGGINKECGGDALCGASYNPGGLIVSNAFISKLNIAGSALVYSTYLGFYENVTGNSIAVDGNGNAYVTGSVEPNGFPTVTIAAPAEPPPPFPLVNSINPPVILTITPTTTFPSGQFDLGFNGIANAYLTEISSTGSSIVYSTYIGGSGEDSGNGVATDGKGNAYVTGLANSADFPTVGGLQSVNNGAGDAFLAKINTAQSGAASLPYSTLLGGTGLDQGNAVAADGAGNAYVAGVTHSIASTLGFTVPAGGFQTNCVLDTSGACEGDAFVAKLNTNLTGVASLSYFTYLGGSLADGANAIAVDSTGNAYVTGSTVSPDFPAAGAVFQSKFGGGNADSFVTKLNPAGTALVYLSYLGGTNTDVGTGIAVDTGGNAYLTGQTCSLDFPLANPLQDVPGTNCDAYVAKVSILTSFEVNPASLVFPAQSLNATSQSQTLTVTNGDNPQTFSSIALSGDNPGDFMESNTCPIAPAQLAVGATCTITVSFTPTGQGLRKAFLTITDTLPANTQVVNLSGSTSTVTLSASSLAFGPQQVGIPSAPQAVTVTNSGSTGLTISQITASGDFSETDDCVKAGVPLPSGTNCVIQVTYTPSAVGQSIGAITLTDSGTGNPQTILATGTGVLEPQASLAPASLGFASQPVGVSSASQAVTLSNTGDAPLTVSSIVVSGDFSQTNTCGAILSANSTCAINVTFTATAAGTRIGTLTVTDNSANLAGSTQAISLTGTGLAVPIVNLSATTLTFNNQAIGSTSPAQIVTLTNIGSAPLIISSVTPSGSFAQINNCPTSVAVGANCAITITFTPETSGNLFGTVTIADNATNNPQTISMSGTGVGVPFQVTSQTATPSVPAGKSAAFAISVVGFGGYSQQVSLNCIAPATLSCSVAPSVVTPSATPAQAATVTVSTSLRTSAPPISGFKIDPSDLLRHFRAGWLLWLVALLMVMTAAIVRRRPVTAAFGFAVVLLLASVACSGSGTPGVAAGTPAGNYQITVTGTSGATTTSTTLTLQVN